MLCDAVLCHAVLGHVVQGHALHTGKLAVETHYLTSEKQDVAKSTRCSLTAV